MAGRNRSRERRRSGKVNKLHYINVVLYAVMLVAILVSVGMMGDGAASCFFQTTAQ